MALFVARDLLEEANQAIDADGLFEIEDMREELVNRGH